MSHDNINQLLSLLESTIKSDRSYYDSVLQDPTYQPILPQVKSLRTKLFKEAKKQNEIEIANLYSQYKLNELFKFKNNHSSDIPAVLLSDINNFESKMNFLNKKTQNDTYHDYRDNIESIKSVKEQINDIIQKFKSFTEQKKQHEQQLESDLNEKRGHLSQLNTQIKQIVFLIFTRTIFSLSGFFTAFYVLSNWNWISNPNYSNPSLGWSIIAEFIIGLTIIMLVFSTANASILEKKGWYDVITSEIISAIFFGIISVVIFIVLIIIVWILSLAPRSTAESKFLFMMVLILILSPIINLLFMGNVLKNVNSEKQKIIESKDNIIAKIKNNNYLIDEIFRLKF